MKRMHQMTAGVAATFLLVLTLCISALPSKTVTAVSPAVPAIGFRQVKISGDEFVVIKANQAVADLSAYWLGYSSNDVASNIVPTQQLPAITLSAGQAVLLTSDAAQTCDAVYTTKLSVSLSDTKGMLQLRQLVTIDKNSSTFTTIDSVNWTKPSTTDKTPVVDNLDLRREAALTTPVWYHDAASASPLWTIGNFANCTLSVPAVTSGTTTTSPAQSYTWPSSGVGPPAIILSLAPEDTAGTALVSGTTMPGTIPISDIGQLPAQITELLPNPTGTGNDATDEFIELYNPNDKPFDLTGFVLQTGITTKHSYTFPAGTMLAANGFTAFYANITGLTLSNTSGGAALLDPLGAVLSETDDYGTAKDGQSWALANGAWYWTLQPSPGKSNTISQTTAASASATSTTVASKSTKVSTAKVKAATAAQTAKVAKTKTAKKTKAPKTATLASSTKPADQIKPLTPIHPTVLAVVAGLAVAYGLYEYRLDMANFIQRFRRHRAPSRANG